MLGSLSTPTAHMATGHVRYATAGSRVPVSYTHLDVYKRQALYIVTLYRYVSGLP